jgi:hypothetical protein
MHSRIGLSVSDQMALWPALSSSIRDGERRLSPDSCSNRTAAVHALYADLRTRWNMPTAPGFGLRAHPFPELVTRALLTGPRHGDSWIAIYICAARRRPALSSIRQTCNFCWPEFVGLGEPFQAAGEALAARVPSVRTRDPALASFARLSRNGRRHPRWRSPRCYSTVPNAIKCFSV